MAFSNPTSPDRATDGSAIRGFCLAPLAIAQSRVALFSILLMASSALIDGTAKAQTAAPAPAAQSQGTPEQEAEWIQLLDRSENSFRSGEFGQGVELARRALALAEAAFGPNHPNSLGSVHNLALFYEAQGRYAEVEPLYIRALEGRERMLGRDHPDTLASVSSLGTLYEVQGRYAEAEPLLIRALEAKERVLGREHPETLVSVISLAVLRYSQGRYAEAEPLYIRALGASERLLGREDPNTLASVNNLALMYEAQGRYAEAEPLLIRALEARERMLGREHPDTLASVNNLGVLYDVQGRYAEAEPLLIRALEAKERVRGSEHPETLGSVNNLARLYEAQGRLAEAEPLYIRALEAFERVLGREHPNTLAAVNNLAGLYVAQARYADAEPLYIRALEAFERVLGREHANTLASVNNLASLLGSQGRYAEAEPLYLRALETSERVLGREHPGTLGSANNLAALYVAQGRYAEAEPLYLQAREASERVLGGEHPDTLASVNNLADLYGAQGRDAEAEPLYLRVLAVRERVLGREHPDTLASVNNLADLYGARGRYAEAEPLYVRARAARERVLGREHPATIVAAANLALVRVSSGAVASAIEPARLAVSSLRSRRVSTATGVYARAQRGREESEGADVFSLLADAAWSVAAGEEDRAALTAESFAALQDATAGTTNRAVIQRAVRRVADGRREGLGVLVRERESLNDQWAANSAGYSAALAGSDADAEVLRRTLLAERARIEARMDAIDATLRDDFAEYFALIRPEALGVAAAQAMLAPDEAILMVVPTRFGTHVMAMGRTGFHWVRSPWTQDQINVAVRRLLWDVGGPVTATEEEEAELTREGSTTYSRRTALALYQQIVAPVTNVLRGKRVVFIAAGGSLTSLPFGLLVTEEPQGADADPAALRATSWFADAHALIQIPSIQSLWFLRHFPRPAGRQQGAAASFVGFGNPAGLGPPAARDRGRDRSRINTASLFSRGRSRSGGAIVNGRELRRLSSLPGTATELENMRLSLGALPDALFLAERATEANVRGTDLSGVRILAFATHGLAGGGVWETAEPGLVFTPPETPSEADDGFLMASEVLTLRLDADWVILSACNTAAGDGSAGAPGLSGLARAFFYAGARNLLASHWPVDDDVAAKLTVRTIQILAEQPALSRAEAFQRAMREIRNDPSHDATGTWAHPGAWAPFSLIGDGAR